MNKDGSYKFKAVKGNTDVSVGDVKGVKVLWSWHIWFTEQPAEQKYENSIKQYAGTLMDRNLGATSGTLGKVEFLGLLYQWGRKDPFPGSYEIHSSEYNAPLAQSQLRIFCALSED